MQVAELDPAETELVYRVLRHYAWLGGEAPQDARVRRREARKKVLLSQHKVSSPLQTVSLSDVTGAVRPDVPPWSVTERG